MCTGGGAHRSPGPCAAGAAADERLMAVARDRMPVDYEWGRTTDPRVLAARTAAVMYASAAGLILVTLAWVPAVDRGLFALFAVSSLIGAIAAWCLPWQRWPQPTQLSLTGAALMMLTGAGVVTTNGLGPYSGFYLLIFVWLGINMPRSTSLAIAPLAALSFLIGLPDRDSAAVLALLVALPTWLIVAETLAYVVARMQRDRQHLRNLFDSTYRLARCWSEEEAAGVAAEVVAEVTGADVVEVMVSDPPGSTRFVNCAAVNSPVPLGEMSTDVATEISATGRCIAGGRPLFYGDLSTADGVSQQMIMLTGARAALFMPLPDHDGCLGAIDVIWHRPRQQPSAQLFELVTMIANETGRALQRTRRSAQLSRQAGTDSLTGLGNRRELERALSDLQRGDAVVLLDLDHFKDVNDTYGHQVGDEALRSFATCLRRESRGMDLAVRYGGEEFAWVSRGTSVCEAEAAVDRLRAAWARTRPLATFSAGVAVHDGPDPDATLREADLALYDAKQAGRNCTSARAPDRGP